MARHFEERDFKHLKKADLIHLLSCVIPDEALDNAFRKQVEHMQGQRDFIRGYNEGALQKMIWAPCPDYCQRVLPLLGYPLDSEGKV